MEPHPFSIVSVTTDSAGATYGHLRDTLLEQPALRQFVVGEPTQDSTIIRSPIYGRNVEIKIVAASKAGNTLVSRWSAGACFDEACRLSGDDASVSLNDMVDNVRGRLLPGASIYMIGSPWASDGPAFDLYSKHYGKPTADLTVVRGRAYDLNPVHWTPAKVAETKRKHPRVYSTDVEAEFGADGVNVVTAELASAITSPRPHLAGNIVAGGAVLGIDAASLLTPESDFFGWAVVAWVRAAEAYVARKRRTPDGTTIHETDERGLAVYDAADTTPLLAILDAGYFRYGDGTDHDSRREQLIQIAQAKGCIMAVSDPIEASAYAAGFPKAGIRFEPIAMSQTTRDPAWSRFVDLVKAKQVMCNPRVAPLVEAELIRIRETFRNSATRHDSYITIPRVRGKGHGDIVAAICTALASERLEGSPFTIPSIIREVHMPHNLVPLSEQGYGHVY